MPVVRMMQPAFDEVVHVITMRDGMVPAVRSVNMTCLVAGGAVSALVWIDLVHRNRVFVYMVTMHVMEMTIVQIVGVSLMFDLNVSAVGPVLMRMVLMHLAVAHWVPFVRQHITQRLVPRKGMFAAEASSAPRGCPVSVGSWMGTVVRMRYVVMA
jgi:hypothetical protein